MGLLESLDGGGSTKRCDDSSESHDFDWSVDSISHELDVEAFRMSRSGSHYFEGVDGLVPRVRFVMLIRMLLKDKAVIVAVWFSCFLLVLIYLSRHPCRTPTVK